MKIVVALGGSALLQRGDGPDAGIQLVHVRAAAQTLAPLAIEPDLLICHGSGPQVDMRAMESAADASLTRAYRCVSPARSMAPDIESGRRFAAAIALVEVSPPPDMAVGQREQRLALR